MQTRKEKAFSTLDVFKERDVSRGDFVRPWIGAGPFFIDVSSEVPGRSLFEDLENGTGSEVFERYIEEGESCMLAEAFEHYKVKFGGVEREYEIIMIEEPLVTWGRYHRGNTLAAMFLATKIIPESSGPVSFRLHARFDNQIAVGVNGSIQYRTYEEEFIRTRSSSWGAEQSFEFRLEFDEGENLLTVGAFRMGRIASGGFYLSPLSSPLRAAPPIRNSIEGVDRMLAETAAEAFHPVREWFYPQDIIRLVKMKDIEKDAFIECRVFAEGKEVAVKSAPVSAGKIDIIKAGEAGTGSIVLSTAVILEGKRLKGREFRVLCLKPAPSLPGPDYSEKRLKIALEHYAGGNDLWAQVCRYKLGRCKDIEAGVIVDACGQLDSRLDCSDFLAHPLLWLLHMDKNINLLDDDLKAKISEAFLNFRYWKDEPGSDCLVMETENHRILFNSIEYLAGSFWPDRIFQNSGLTGREHMGKGRKLAIEWLRERGRTGFREWNSRSYYPHWMTAVLSLFEYAPADDGEIRRLSENLLHYGCFILANDSFDGILGTSQGRIYTGMLKIPDTDGCVPMNWLLFGKGNLNHVSAGVAPLAAGSYRPPAFFNDVANASEKMLTRHHQGDANFMVYRTRDYMMSVLQDFYPGETRHQVNVFHLTFQEKAAVFFSCPHTSIEGGGQRPDYWSGNAYLPRAFGKRGTAVLLFRLGDAGWISHCYFEKDRFDAVIEKNPWIFARKNNAYVGIWSEHDFELRREGAYSGRELICRAPENAWIVETGSRSEWGSFESFISKIGKGRPRRKQGKLVYDSANEGRISMGWDGPVAVDGEIENFDYPLLESFFGESDYAAGKIRLGRGEKEVVLYF